MADVQVEIVQALAVGKAQQLVPNGLVFFVLRWHMLHALCAVGLQEQALAQHTCLFVGLHLEVVADARACPCRAYKAQPGRLGCGIRVGNDLHHVTAGQFGAQRSLTVVDQAADGAVAHIAVDGIGKIDHGGAAWQRHDPVLGREYEHVLGEQVQADMVQEFVGVQCFLLDVEQALEPVGRLAALAVGRCLFAVRLVQPVRRHARLGHLVHGIGAHLEFHMDAGRTDQRGVQRLVAVVLGNGDEILEALRHRLVERVQDAQCQIAIGIARHDDAETEDVIQLGKALLLAVHLAVDGEDGFLARLDAGLEAGGGKGVLDVLLHFLHQMATTAARVADGLGQCFVAPGVQILEGQVFQFAVGAVQAQAVGNGSVDFQCFGGDAALRVGLHVRHGAHVVRAVGQLDQDDAHVGGHGQQHLAEGLGLVFLPAAELQLVQFGEAVHQFRHRGAELLRQFFLGDAAVLHGVVQQRGHQGRGVEFPFGTLRSNRNRVRDVRFAALARLAQVRLVCQLVGRAHARDLILGQVVEFVEQGGKAGGGGSFGRGRSHAAIRSENAGVRNGNRSSHITRDDRIKTARGLAKTGAAGMKKAP